MVIGAAACQFEKELQFITHKLSYEDVEKQLTGKILAQTPAAKLHSFLLSFSFLRYLFSDGYRRLL